MKNTMNNFRRLCHGVTLLLTMALSVNVISAQTTESWTTVGSAGTVDDGSLANLALGADVAQLSAAAPANTTAFIRYNVTATDGLFPTNTFTRMLARFQDNGTDSRVVATLIRVPLNGGAPQILLTLDSNVFAPQAGLQTQFVETSSCISDFNFSLYAYYVSVQLSRTAAGGFPILSSLQLNTRTGNWVGWTCSTFSQSLSDRCIRFGVTCQRPTFTGHTITMVVRFGL